MSRDDEGRHCYIDQRRNTTGGGTQSCESSTRNEVRFRIDFRRSCRWTLLEAIRARLSAPSCQFKKFVAPRPSTKALLLPTLEHNKQQSKMTNLTSRRHKRKKCCCKQTTSLVECFCEPKLECLLRLAASSIRSSEKGFLLHSQLGPDRCGATAVSGTVVLHED